MDSTSISPAKEYFANQPSALCNSVLVSSEEKEREISMDIMNALSIKTFIEVTSKKFSVEALGLLRSDIDIKEEQRILTRLAAIAECVRFAKQEKEG